MIQETLYIGQRCLSPLQNRHVGISHSSPNCHQFPHCIFLNLIDSLKSLAFHSKVILGLGKARNHRAPYLGCRGAESPRWFDVSPKKLCMRYDAWAGTLLWWSCQSPDVHSCGLLNHLNSFCRGMFKLTAKFDADLLLDFLSHFECDGHSVHMLTHWCLLPPLMKIEVIIVHS